MNRYRLTFTLLGLALAAVVIGAVVFAPSGRPDQVPEVVESYSPSNESTVLRQTEVQIDLPVDYGITLVIDGVAIPENEIIATPETGRFVWRPSDTTIIPEWSPGIHTVWVRWDRIAGLPDPGEWSWVFRVQ
ncbi:MAG: hypothetical protein QNJ77_00770 [Acidimicrobiia bacterium]|nr:hypothetical protein [Acidimicrobiia bacterium]